MREGYKDSAFGEIPVEWEVDEIKNVTSYVDYRGKTPQKVKDGVFLVTSKNIKRGKIIYSLSQEYVLEEHYSQIMSRGVPQIGDVLITTEAPLGEVASVDRNDIALAQRIIKYRGDKEIIDNCFLKYSFLSQYFQDSLDKESTGSTVKGIKGSRLHKLKIIIPTLPEQQKIAQILSTVDDKIDVIDQQIAETTELKKGLMQRLLTKGTRWLSGVETKDSPLGEIPEDWDIRTIGEIAEVTAGGTPSTKEGDYWGGDIPWMNSGEINLRKIKAVEGRITKKGLENSSTKIIQKNSVLMALAGQGKTRGKVAINKLELCTNQSLAAIFNFRNAHYEYIFQNLEARYAEVRKMSTGDGGRGGLNLSIIKTIKVALPPLEEQEKISDIFLCVDNKLEVLKDKKAEYQGLKKGLMQQLLTGKVRVKVEEGVAQ